MPVGPPQLRDRVLGKFPADEPDRVHTVDPRPIADGFRKRKRIFRYDGISANKRMSADPTILVHAGKGANRRIVFNEYVSSERRAVGKNRFVPDLTVVRHVRV